MAKTNKILVIVFVAFFLITLGEIGYYFLTSSPIKISSQPVNRIVSPVQKIEENKKTEELAKEKRAVPKSQIDFFDKLEKTPWVLKRYQELNGYVTNMKYTKQDDFYFEIIGKDNKLMNIINPKSNLINQTKFYIVENDKKIPANVKDYKDEDKVSQVRIFDMEKELGSDFISQEIIVYR